MKKSLPTTHEEIIQHLEEQELQNLVQLKFVWEDNLWRIVPVNDLGNDQPKVSKNEGVILWELTKEGPEIAVLQLNQKYFIHRDGAPMDSETGIVILSRKEEGAKNYVILRVNGSAIPTPPSGGEYLYVYTTLCMNGGGEVRKVEDELIKGDVGGWLAYKDLTFATSRPLALDVAASPPSMIIM